MDSRKNAFWLLIAILAIVIVNGCKVTSMNRDEIAKNDFRVALIDSTVPVMASDLYLRLAKSNLLEKGGTLDSSTYFDTLQDIVLDSIISIDAGKVDLRKNVGLYRTYKIRFEDFYLNYLFQHIILDSIRVDSVGVESFYRAHPELFGYREQVRAKQLVISAAGLKLGKDSLLYKDYPMDQLDSIARAMVVDLRSKVDSGADFGLLAYDYSMNRESGKKNGELGYFFRNTFNKEFEDVAFSLPKETVSQPFKTPDGWHLVYVIDHVDSGFAPLTPEIYSQVSKSYANEIAKVRSGLFIDSLSRAADIRFNDSALSGNIHKVPESTWAATVNDIDTITFYRLPDMLSGFKMDPESDTMTLPEIHNALAYHARKLLLFQAGNKLGFMNDPEVVKKKDYFFHKYAVEIIKDSSRDLAYTPPDSLIMEYYNKNIDKFVFKEPIYVQHIIVQDSIFGEFLRDQALSGIKFLDLAKQYYPGAEEIRVAAADLGYIGPGEMPDNFYRIAIGTPVNGYSHPVRTEWGYHIVHVIDRLHDKTIDQVRPGIADSLRKQHDKEFLKQWRQDLMRRHRIEYSLDRIKRLELAAKERR